MSYKNTLGNMLNRKTSKRQRGSGKDQTAPQPPPDFTSATSHLEVNLTSSSQPKWKGPKLESPVLDTPSHSHLLPPSNVQHSSASTSTRPCSASAPLKGCFSTDITQYRPSPTTDSTRPSFDVNSWASSLFDSPAVETTMSNSRPGTPGPRDLMSTTSRYQRSGPQLTRSQPSSSPAQKSSQTTNAITASASLPQSATWSTIATDHEEPTETQEKKKRKIFNIKSALGREKRLPPTPAPGVRGLEIKRGMATGPTLPSASRQSLTLR